MGTRSDSWRTEAWVRGRSRIFRTVFRDRAGAAIFLGALAFFMLYWRADVFINDNYTMANLLVALSDGHLYLEHIVYGPASGATPGTRTFDGQVYGRNYGLAVMALPVLWALQAITAIADLRVALAGLWSLCLLGTALQVGHLLERQRIFVWFGSGVALGVFGLNLVLMTALDPRWIYLLALQLSTMLAAALVGVVLYRLVAAMATRRTGIIAGVAVSLASPVGFWAPLPKRHTLIALLALLSVFSFYLSRQADDGLRYRVGSYACVGLSAWVFPAEGLLLLAALAPVDLLTAPPKTLRTVAALGGGLFVSLLPFFVTNTLISGNPVVPPAMLPGYRGDTALLEPPVPPEDPSQPPTDGTPTPTPTTTATPTTEPEPSTTTPSTSPTPTATETTATGTATTQTTPPDTSTATPSETTTPATSTATATPTSTATTSGPTNETTGNVSGPPERGVFAGVVAWLVSVLKTGAHLASIGLDAGVTAFERFYDFLRDGLDVVFHHPDRLYHIYIRSGYITTVTQRNALRPITLSLLESLPLAGALLGVPLVGVQWLRQRSVSTERLSPARQTDVLVVVYVLVVTLFYLPRLPIHASVTVRYLLPTMPLLLYGVFRLASVQTIVEQGLKPLLVSYASGVLIGGQLLVATTAVFAMVLGEAVQLHALLSLALAISVAVWLALVTILDRDLNRLGGVCLGLAGAATTTFVLLFFWAYFDAGGAFILPIVDGLSGAL